MPEKTLNHNMLKAILLTMVAAGLAPAQTQLNGSTQVKNLVVSPIQSITRAQCIGTGAGWDCSGFQTLQLTLTDGTVLGPYILMPATKDILTATSVIWQPIPLAPPPALAPAK